MMKINWKDVQKVVVAKFKALALHLPKGNEENHDKPQNGPPPGRDLNPGTPEYEAGVPTTRPRH
jgi:hypothetical protein